MTSHLLNQAKPSSTTLPMVVPLSSCACAFLSGRLNRGSAWQLSGSFRHDRARHLIEDSPLFVHIRSLEDGPRKHEFMMDRYRLALELHGCRNQTVVDQAKTPLRCDQFCDVVDMLGGLRRGEYKGGGANAQCRDLASNRLRVIDFMGAPSDAAEIPCLRTRSRRNNGEAGELTCDLVAVIPHRQHRR